MTCLPLIERELRVRARGRPLYRWRLAAGLAGAFICIPPMMLFPQIIVMGYFLWLIGRARRRLRATLAKRAGAGFEFAAA